MTERTFTESEIDNALEFVAFLYRNYDKISFNDIMTIENVLMKVQLAIKDGVPFDDWKQQAGYSE